MTYQSPPVAITKTKGSNMAARRRRMGLIMLLCIWKAGRIQGFSNSAGLQLGQLSRGGDMAEEDKQLDESIEDLISTVESSEDYSSEEVEEENVAISDSYAEAMEPNDEEIDPDVVNSVGDEHDDKEETEEPAKDAEEPENELELTRRKDAVEDILEPRLTENDDDDNAGGKADESVVGEITSSPDAETEGKPRKRKKKRSSQEAVEEKPLDEHEDAAVKEEASPTHQSLAPARPPNALYRFLLNQGRIGHILIMFCVFVVEFVKTYIPPLAHFLGFIFSFLLPHEEDHSSYYRRTGGPPQKVNAQYAAFVSSDGSSVRGKKRKEQVRKDDKQAVEKLRRVGSIQDAKFRHVSLDFMKRCVTLDDEYSFMCLCVELNAPSSLLCQTSHRALSASGRYRRTRCLRGGSCCCWYYGGRRRRRERRRLGCKSIVQRTCREIHPNRDILWSRSW
jgi:hypothetical protein